MSKKMIPTKKVVKTFKSIKHRLNFSPMHSFISGTTESVLRELPGFFIAKARDVENATPFLPMACLEASFRAVAG